MAALGALPVATVPNQPTILDPLSAYTVHRGMVLGRLLTIVFPARTPIFHAVANYIVRQISIVYRQLWPVRGQRFPQ